MQAIQVFNNVFAWIHVNLEPYMSFIVALLFLVLTIKFYNGQATWLMIHYGCAPKSKRDKMPQKLIENIAWISFAFIFAMNLVAGVCSIITYYYISGLLHFICICLFIVMNIVTFILCQIKKK